MKIKNFIMPQKEFSQNPEVVANKYAIHGMSIAIIALTLIWALNTLHIFVVDQATINAVTLNAVIIYFLGAPLLTRMDLSKPWVKYVILFWAFLILSTITTMLTYHAYLISILLILYSSMYSSKRVTQAAYFLTVLNMFHTAFVGYYFGLCDANLVLLTGKPMSAYLDAAGNWTQVKVNDNVAFTVTLYYVIPRCILCLVIALTCSNISKIIRSNITYAHEMEKFAEIDEMTGVYNRNKYLSMTSEAYEREDKIAVIFWDANKLKFINDTMGHEHGDSLLISLANSIRTISDKFDHVYRVGGDEFVMIIRGGDEIDIQKKIADWENCIKNMPPIQGVPVSASYGFAYGAGKDLDQIIHNADMMMYDNKRIYHENN